MSEDEVIDQPPVVSPRGSREMLVSLLLAVLGVACILAAIGMLAGGWWALLAGGMCSVWVSFVLFQQGDR